MSILQKIKQHKLAEVATAKKETPVEQLREAPLFYHEVTSMSASVLSGSGIISEFKRASPSKGDINLNADVREVVSAYEQAGASAVSVLTDQEFFKARPDDILQARATTSLPILRKDFIVDPYQIYEAKSLGADTILLIAAILTASEVNLLTSQAHDLGLEVLIEIHSEEELEVLCGRENMVGINNRNLNDFSVDLNRSIQLLEKISSKAVKVAESGISGSEDLIYLKKSGFDGFLIGEHFMKTLKSGKSVEELISLAKK